MWLVFHVLILIKNEKRTIPTGNMIYVHMALQLKSWNFLWKIKKKKKKKEKKELIKVV